MKPSVVHGDATTPEAYQKALGGDRADALLSDPPYCLLTRRRKGGDERDKKGRKVEQDPAVRFESVRDYRTFTEAWMTLAFAHLKPGAPAIIWTNFLGKEPIVTAAAKLGYPHLAGEFVWAKRTKDVQGNEELLRVYEVALVLLPAPLERPAHAPPIPWSVVAGYDDEGQGAAFGNHPHHKPFGVLEPLIEQWTRPNDLVFDPFAGSGSIPAAAERLQRRAAGIELKGDWADLVRKRLVDARSKATGAPRVFELPQGYELTDDRGRVDIDAVHATITASYWAAGIPRALVARAIENSLCFSVFHAGVQVGFARVVTDFATFAYLADVYVRSEHQRRGIGKALVAAVRRHPRLQGLRRWLLATKDAHAIYAAHGFAALKNPERLMEIVDPDIYRRARPTPSAWDSEAS